MNVPQLFLVERLAKAYNPPVLAAAGEMTPPRPAKPCVSISPYRHVDRYGYPNTIFPLAGDGTHYVDFGYG